MNSKNLIGFALCGFLTPVFAGDNGVHLETSQQKLSYAIGMNVAQSISRQGVDLDISTFTLGVSDALAAKTPRLSQEEIRAALTGATTAVNDKLKARAKTNLDAGQAFLKKHKIEAGVVELKDGLQYKVLEKGTGVQPKPEDKVVVHYEGRLINGEVFDSSRARGTPVTFPINGVIKGWQEVLPLMATGARWKVVIPPDLAYGAQGAGASIGPNETLVFDIELLEIKK